MFEYLNELFQIYGKYLVELFYILYQKFFYLTTISILMMRWTQSDVHLTFLKMPIEDWQ